MISFPVRLSMISDLPRRGLNEMVADKSTLSPSSATVVEIGEGRGDGSEDSSGGDTASFKRFSFRMWMASVPGPTTIRGETAFSHLAYSTGVSIRARHEACMPNRWQISEEDSSPDGM